MRIIRTQWRTYNVDKLWSDSLSKLERNKNCIKRTQIVIIPSGKFLFTWLARPFQIPAESTQINVIFYFQRMLCNPCDRETAALWWSIRTLFEPLHQKLLKKDLRGKKKIISTSPSNCSPIKVQINKENIIYRFSSDYSVLHTYTKFDKIQNYISNSNKIVKTSSNILTCSNNKKEGRRKVGTVANIWVAILWAIKSSKNWILELEVLAYLVSWICSFKRFTPKEKTRGPFFFVSPPELMETIESVKYRKWSQIKAIIQSSIWHACCKALAKGLWKKKKNIDGKQCHKKSHINNIGSCETLEKK